MARKITYKHWLIMTAAAVQLGAGQAAAQTAPGPASVEEVVVTGSRVIQNGNDMPTPVTVVTTEQLLRTTPTSVIDAVQALPVFAGSTGPQGGGGRGTDNNGARTLNIRNLGATRGLVLFDGMRVPPTSQTGTVNTNFIPSMLLQRVDVVTGGASAVYGSDAVAGVVNFITDRNFNGLKIEGNVGISSRDDFGKETFGIAAGTPIGDRLHVEGSYQYYNLDGVTGSTSGRRNTSAIWNVVGAGTAANPFVLISNSRTINTTSKEGLITTGPLADMVFKQNGVLSPFIHGTRTGVSTIESGGDGYYFDRSAIGSFQQTHQLFGRVDYDLTDDVHAHLEAVGSFQKGHNSFSSMFISSGGALIANNNPFLPADIRARLAAATGPGGGPNGSFRILKAFPDRGSDAFAKVETYMINAGLEGAIADWKWTAGFVTSRNEQTVWQINNYSYPKVYAALDATINPANGQIVCRVTLTHPNLYPGCLPLNPFGPTAANPAAVDWFLMESRGRPVTTMNEVAGSIAGSPFSTWAGPVGIAISGDWRKLRVNVTTNIEPSLLADCTGLTTLANGAPGNCGPNTVVIGSQSVGSITGSQTVAEGAAEAEVPLLRDVAFAESLSLSGAARYADYDTSGGVWSWKVGANWRVNDQITFRAVRSQDIRAPNLNELFASPSRTTGNAQDLHVNGVVKLSRTESKGNRDLVPEIADTWTAGVVVRPAFVPGFSLALDYYKIKIDNAVINQNGTNLTVQRACESSNGTSPLCDLIVRPGPFSDRSLANEATLYLISPVNTQAITTSGFDLDAGYRRPLFNGSIDLRALFTYQPHFYQAAFQGAPRLDLADVPPLAKKRLTLFAGYTVGDLSVNVRHRWRSSYWWNADRTLVYNIPRISAFHTTDLTVGYKVREKAEVYFTVENLFDRKPPPYSAPNAISGLAASGSAPGDDVVGRYFIVGFRIKG